MFTPYPLLPIPTPLTPFFFPTSSPPISLQESECRSYSGHYSCSVFMLAMKTPYQEDTLPPSPRSYNLTPLCSVPLALEKLL